MWTTNWVSLCNLSVISVSLWFTIAKKNTTTFHHTAYHITCAYAIMNRHEQALKWLESVANNGFPCGVLFERDHNLDNLRQDARFQALLAKLKQQWEQYKRHPKAVANAAKHFAFTRCGELNLYGMVDAQIAVAEGELLADSC